MSRNQGGALLVNMIVNFWEIRLSLSLGIELLLMDWLLG